MPPKLLARFIDTDREGTWLCCVGERQWALAKGGDVIEAHLARCGPNELEYRIFLNGRISFTERVTSRESAALGLAGFWTRLREEGWYVIEPPRPT